MRSFCAGERIIDSENLQAMLANFEELPTLPDILFQILKILDDPQSGASDLADVVRLDAPLTARILRLANSPYYSTRGDMADIHRCIAVLGYRTIRQVAICVSVATSVVSATASAKGHLDYKGLWRHSVATGAIAKYLAEMSGHLNAEEMFTAGLLHDLGKFVLEIYAPQSYGGVVQSRKETGQTLVEVERDAFGFDHAVLGEAFGFSWRFPGILTHCCGYHHETIGGSCEPGSLDQAVALVALADNLAHSLVPSGCDLGFDAGKSDTEALITAAALAPEVVAYGHDAMAEAVGMSSIYLDFD